MIDQDQLFTRAMAIADQQAKGVPVDWIAEWPAWRDDLARYVAECNAEPAAENQLSLL